MILSELSNRGIVSRRFAKLNLKNKKGLAGPNWHRGGQMVLAGVKRGTGNRQDVSGQHFSLFHALSRTFRTGGTAGHVGQFVKDPMFSTICPAQACPGWDGLGHAWSTGTIFRLRIDLGLLQLAAVVDIERFPLAKDIEHLRAGFAMAVAGGLWCRQTADAPRRRWSQS